MKERITEELGSLTPHPVCAVLYGDFPNFCPLLTSQTSCQNILAHQNRTIAIASDCCVDGAKSPEIPQKEGILDPEIAARNRNR